MSSYAAAPSAVAGDRSAIAPDTARDRARRRAMRMTTAIALLSLGLLIDLLLVGHSIGGQIWGPMTAAFAAMVAGLSLAFLAVRRRNRAARIGLIALWLSVAFLGFGGYNDHRLPRPADTVTDQRQRPPLAPLVFTGMGIAGALSLRAGTKGN